MTLRITMTTKKLFVLISILLGATCLPAFGQDSYPSRTTRLVTGFPTGILDLLARQLAQKLATQMGTNVIVNNRSGANGDIAAEYVAKANADGYTLLVNTSSVVFGPALGEKMAYDVLRDLAPVSLLASSSFVLVALPTLPANSMSEFIAHAKANPDKLAYGSTGTGSVTHLGPLLFLQGNGLSALHVPYKGGAQVITDLLGGQIQFAMQGLANTMPMIKANRLKAYAYTGLRRTPLLPSVPTLHETVMPGFELSTWQAVMSPIKTPAAVLQRLNTEIVRALQDPEVRSRIASEGAEIRATSAAEYGSYLKSELERWTRIVKANNIKAD